MGYTHYIYQKPELSLEQFKLFSDDCRTITELSNISIQFDLDNNNPPQMTQKIVRFNGIGEAGHETFWLERTFTPEQYDEIENGFYFSFCETARKPYDEIVVACLYSAKYNFGSKIHLESDGKEKDRMVGRELFVNATGKTTVKWDCDI